MSCSCCCCCCCVAPSRELLQGTRKKERLLPEEEPAAGAGAGGGEEEQSRRNMDISLLREQYRSSREKQRTQTQVLLFRKVSEELSEAVSIVPVTQGLTPSLPAITFDPDPTTYDPWHVHLDLHRRSRSIVTIQLPVSSPETNTSIDSSSRRSSSSSLETGSSQHESRCRKLSVDSAPDSLRSFRETSPCRSFNSKQENLFNVDRSRDPDSERSTGDSFGGSMEDTVQVTGSFGVSEQRYREGPPDSSISSSKEDSVCSSFTDSQECSAPSTQASPEESSTPVASITSSPSSSTTNLNQDPNKTQSQDTKTTNGDLQTSSTSASKGCRKLSAPANRFTRQLSVGGECSSTGLQQKQNYYPFPNRKTPRISEAARRLGMYSSF